MNILVVNHYAGAPTLGMEYRTYYFAREWQNSGHKVLIVTSSFTHLRSKQIDVVNNNQSLLIEGINYLVFKTPSYEGNNYKRILNIVAFLISLKKNWKKISKNFLPDVVIVSSTFCFDIYSSKKIAAYTKAKLIFEVHDLWPLSPMELGRYSKWHPYIYLMQRAEQYAYENSDKVVSILPKTEEYMLEHGLAPDKFVHIPNGIYIDDWNRNEILPEQINVVITELKSKETKLLAYVGNHGIANALSSLVDAMKALENENIALLLVGNGQEKVNLIKRVEALNLKNVFFLNAIPKTYIPALLDKMDFLYVGLQNQPVFRFGISPNKLIDYLMAAKPIIQAINAGNDIVKEAGCGISIEPENIDEIVKAVKFLLSSSEDQRFKMGSNGKRYCINNHDYKILADQFIMALE